jgi:transcriptional regulator with XRE-family HTH domain
MSMSEVVGATVHTPLRLRVAAEVRAWRARRSMTQQQLARALGVSQGQMSAKLRGLQPISLDEIELLSVIFSCTPEELMHPALVEPVTPPAGLGVTSAQTRHGLRSVTDRIDLPLRRDHGRGRRRPAGLPQPVLAGAA